MEKLESKLKDSFVSSHAKPNRINKLFFETTQSLLRMRCNYFLRFALLISLINSCLLCNNQTFAADEGKAFIESNDAMINGGNNLKLVKMVAAGTTHCVALKLDGTVWCWGDNTFGQLGNGNTISQTTPTQVIGLTGVIDVAAGRTHSLALKADGTVWAWGDCSWCQLGIGAEIDEGPMDIQPLPVLVPNLTNVIQVGAGGYHSVALKADGTVWSWGANFTSQIGDGTTPEVVQMRNLPVQVAGLRNVIEISKYGYFHTLALKKDGTVWAWGQNLYGQIGDGTKIDVNIPKQVLGISACKSIAAGYYRSYAVATDGTVWAWGNDPYNPYNTITISPTKIPNLTSVKAMSDGYNHSLILKEDGTVWGFGYNYMGSLNGLPGVLYSGVLYPLQGTTTPIQFESTTGIACISAGFSFSVYWENPSTVIPKITTQPASRTVIAGQKATFSVAASGITPLSFQWRKNSINISGATSANYTTPVTTIADSGSSFSVVINNSVGSITSGNAILTVTPASVAPSITTQPVSKTVTAGQTASFSVIATGTATLTYQWRKNGINISGATGATYTTPVTSTTDNGALFSVVISNSVGSITSSNATLTVNPVLITPSITTQPTSKTVTAGQTASFSVIATGTATLTYQWRKNGVNITGATGATYTTPVTTITDNGALFSVVISNSVGSVTSSNATLSVNPADTTGPTLEIASTIIKGSVADSSGVAGLTVNGITVTINTNGTWQQEVPINSATTTIIIKATDTKGNITNKTVIITK